MSSPDKHPPLSSIDRVVLLLALLAAGGLLYLFSPILTPFVVSAFLAYMGDPLVDRLEARGVPRAAGVSAVFVGILSACLLVILVFLPLLQQQIVTLFAKLPHYLEYLQQHWVPAVVAKLGLDPELFNLAAVKSLIAERWQQAGGFAKAFVGSVFSSGLMMLAWLANLILIPVVTFYLLRDWDFFIGRLRELIPRAWEGDTVKLIVESDVVLSAFLRGQLLVMLALATVYSMGLWLVGLEFSLLIGVIAGLVSFVPYLGFIVGAGLATVAAYLQFQEFGVLLAVVAVFGVGQLLESFVLTPKLVGDRIGLHPVAVIFAVMAGGQLFGFFGILLALPVAAVLMVVLRHMHERYLQSRIYGQ